MSKRLLLRLCANCGTRYGLHQFGADECPNPAWKTGNGQPQWLRSVFTERPPAPQPKKAPA